MDNTTPSHAFETDEEFLQRAGRVFPVEASRSWSRFERSVFNHLLGKLVHRHGYAGISDAMLDRAHREMQEIVSRASPPVMH